VLVCPACGEENPERFRLCGFCGAPLTAAPPPSVRKTVTAVFSDVTGSTALGERLDPEALRALMQRYFEEMRTVLERHGGTVEKFIGDAVVAVFGVPHVHEDDALRAVRAAAEMRERVVALNEELERDWGASIEVRTGVNTGEVVAGDPASGQSFATGDTVNVAARLEQTAEPGDILLGEATQRLVRDAVEAEPVEPLTLKGKAHGVSAWRLLSVSPHAPGLTRRLDSPLVGRTSELELLEQAFERAARECTCELVTVLGEAGVGKSRLTEELVARCADRATVLRGRCLPYGEGITFWPVAEVIKQAAGIREDDSPEAVRARIGDLLAESDDAALIAGRAAGALGLSDATGAIQETFWAVRKLFEALALRQPLVVEYDDIHWGEPGFLDLLEYLAGWTKDAPVVLLCLARPDLLETRPGWGGSIIRLKALSTAESAKLIESLLDQAQLADEAAAHIVEAAQGNPLYVEEFLRMLVDDGLLYRENGRWLPAGDLSEIAIPPSIAALLAARLDLLAAEERDVLERGSVVGQVFYWGAVADLSPPETRGGVGANLQALVRKELVRPEADGFGGEDTFRFHHILIRDAAYGGIAKLERARLHERFAAWLEQKTSERVLEFEEILGYHLEQAYQYRAQLGPVDDVGRQLAQKAAERLAGSGQRALDRGDIRAAANLLRRAATMLPEGTAERAEVLIQLTDALVDMGEFAQAEGVLAEARQSAGDAGDVRLEMHARLLAANLERYTTRLEGWSESALRASQEALAPLEDVGDEVGLARAYELMAMVHWIDADIDRSQQVLERALAHARRAGAERDESRILAWLLTCEFWGSRHVDLGLDRCREIRERYPGNLWIETHVLQVMGGSQAMKGELAAARASTAEAITISGELDLPLRVAECISTVGTVELIAGDPVAAEHAFRRCHGILEELSEQNLLASNAAYLAEALYRQGRFEEAGDWALVGEKRAAPDDPEAQSGWLRVRAKLLAREGEGAEGERLAREAVALMRRHGNAGFLPEALLDLAEVLVRASRADEAKPILLEALAINEAKGNLASAARVRALLAELGSI
jgi:class 3 adenylate cyclase/tetratricopeptide (TPR) repeat protein